MEYASLFGKKIVISLPVNFYFTNTIKFRQ